MIHFLAMIHLLIAGNKNVGKGLLMVVLSYLSSNESPVTIHFLTMDLHESSPEFVPPSQAQFDFIRRLLKRKNEESDILVYDVKEEFLKYRWEKKFKHSSYTPYALARLFADFLPLPEKVLYLDTDTFILGDISPLYDFDIEEVEFAACLDQIGRFWINRRYQNSGVLLLNMKKAKQTKLFENCRLYLENRHPILADQDALNKAVEKKLFLPQIYNEQKRLKKDTVIRHFSKTIRWFPFFHTVNIKPWQTDKIAKWEKSNRYDGVLAEFDALIEEYEAL